MNETIKVMQGDCLDLLAGLPGQSVDLILTDPPYHVGMTHNSQKATFSDLAMLKPFFDQVLAQCRRVLKDDGAMYCFTDWRTAPFLQPLFDRHIGAKNLLVWDKSGRPSPNYSHGHEPIFFCGSHRRRIYKSNIIKSPSFCSGAQYQEQKVHPTQKPAALLAGLIEDGSDTGDTVLDCFMGGGSTGVACIRTGRHFIGMELDEDYFQTASKRLHEEWAANHSTAKE